jgi:predicted DNA-binding protein (MmcQ/YjbR family)
MNIETLRDYCLSKPHTREGTPFDEHTLVFYVGDKIFALVPIDEEKLQVNLKCDPAYAMELREQFESVRPGYHMNKKHWNTVLVESLKDEFLRKLIDDSYVLVINGMTKKKRNELQFLHKM